MALAGGGISSRTNFTGGGGRASGPFSIPEIPLADSKQATDEKRRPAEYDRETALVGRGRALKSRRAGNTERL